MTDKIKKSKIEEPKDSVVSKVDPDPFGDDKETEQKSKGGK